MFRSSSGPRALVFALALTLLLTACGEPTPEPEPPAAEPSAVEGSGHHDGSAIAWFEGEVDDAFALASSEGRPLFLYWGAVWCPPCHYLKTKVFTRPDFAARLESFVAVYLDGDTPRAQILGEKYQTTGYPTVIVFDPTGHEVTRLDTLLPVDHYLEALDAAMAASRPVTDVVAAVEADGVEGLSENDFRLLAFHSWGQEAELDLEAGRRRALFGLLWRETPAELEIPRARFFSLYLAALERAEGEEALGAEERATLEEEVRAILGDPSLRRSNLELVLYQAEETVSLLHPEAGPGREALVGVWLAAASAIESDETLTVDDRLSAVFPALVLAGLDGGEPSAELVERVGDRVRWASEAAQGESELQAVMSTMTSLLSEAGLADEAETLLAERARETVAPYYYLSWLGSLRIEDGDEDRGLELYREAALAASEAGGTTGFRWGTGYLRRLLELRPEDTGAVSEETERIVGRLLEQEDAFAGGNWSRLERLGDSMLEWSEGDPARAEVVSALRVRVHAVCAELPEEGPESAGGRCRAFLAG